MIIRKYSSTIATFCHLFDFNANAKSNWCFKICIDILDDIVYRLKYLYSLYKCTMKKYDIHARTSVSPTRQRRLRPKTQDYGLIISIFQSYEFNFGINLSKDEIDKVN